MNLCFYIFTALYDCRKIITLQVHFQSAILGLKKVYLDIT